MAKKKKQKPSIGSDPFSGHEEIMENFFSPGQEAEGQGPSIVDCGSRIVDLKSEIPNLKSEISLPATDRPSTIEEDIPAPCPLPSAPQSTIDNCQFSIDNDMLPTFQTELEEGLEQLDPLLMNLEKNPDDLGLINEVFRIVHTIKGSSGFMQFHKLKDLCHGLESLLSQVRNKKLSLTVVLMDIILQAVDKMKEAQSEIAAGRGDGGLDAEMLLSLLESLAGEPAEGRSQEPGVRSQEKESSIADGGSRIADSKSEIPDPKSEISSPIVMDKEIIDEFIQESRESLDQLDVFLISLEDNPEDKDLLNKVFRIMHTLKGAAGFMGFSRIQATAHKSEDILNKIRSGELKSTSVIVDVLLEALDVIKNLIKDLFETGVEKTDHSHVVERLRMVLEQVPGSPFPVPSSQPSVSCPKPPASLADGGARIADASTGLGTGLKSEIPNPKSPIPAKQAINTIRVDVERLDHLMNLAGELVLARNRQIQLNRDIDAELRGKDKLLEEISGAAGQLDFITMELQFAVMKTRMLPISTVFGKFTRVVRDLSRSLGKQVELVIEGEGTELDKNIVEEIGDPMVHLIRNSVDHGIETPEERQRNGKNPRGTVNLSAYHEGSYVIIEIKDDGKGMDPEKLKAKAVEKGIITKEEAEAMSQGQALRLIFAPGFSTAEKVSDVSGRGVGMDVVRSNIEKLKGIIELESVAGQGSLIKIKIPLTLAILPTLHCAVGKERYGVPLSTVKETVRIPDSEVQTIRGKSVVKLRDEILPLAFLKEILEVETAPTRELCIIVLQLGTQRLGCVVDNTIGQEDVVIKPLDAIKHICPTPLFSGASILGNGSITLILDISELMRLVHAGGIQEGPGAEAKKSIEDAGDVLNALLVEDGGAEQYALPLRSIKKIENIFSRDIELVGGRKVVKNEGIVLPVVHLYDITLFPPSKPENEVYLLIMGENGDRAGLVVNRLRGIKPLRKNDMEDCFSASGVDHSTVLGERVTLVLSDEAIFQCVRDYARSPRAAFAAEAAPVSRKRGKILVVDDSAVARESIKKFLIESEFEVVLAVDGKDALQKISGIDLVVTDLEMPEMNGYELTRALKKSRPELPVIMVTTRDGEEDRLEGLRAGVDDYQAKLDGLKLVHSVQRHMKGKNSCP